MSYLTINIPASRLGKLQKQLGKSLMPFARSALDRTGQKAVQMLRAQTVSRNAVDKGDVLEGWHYSLTGAGVFAELTIGNLSNHAIFVLRGRSANRRPPPSSALIGWVTRRLGVPLEDTKRVAFLVARAIGRRGIKARDIVSDVHDRVMRVSNTELERAMDRARHSAVQAAQRSR